MYIILKVQYLAWYERVRTSEKGRKKDNLWYANSRAISKSHYLDFLLLLLQSHGKLCCWSQNLHLTPRRVNMQRGITALRAVSNFNPCLH